MTTTTKTPSLTTESPAEAEAMESATGVSNPNNHWRIVALDSRGEDSVLAMTGKNRDIAYKVMGELRKQFKGATYKIQYKEMEEAR